MASLFDEHPLYTKAKTRRRLARDLLGGTEAMRQNAAMWLPRWTEEDLVQWKARIERAFLFGGFEDAVDRVVSKPFSRPMAVMGWPEQLKPLLQDIDRRGTAIQPFTRRMFQHLVAFGNAFAYTAFPDTSALRGADGTITFQALSSFRVRPFATLVHPLRVKWWLWEEDDVGTPYLAEVRVHETAWVLEDDQLTEKQRVRRLMPGRWELWQKNGKDEVPIAGGDTGLDSIPFVVVATAEDEEDPMVCPPPLEPLQWANLEHFQSSAEQRGALAMARAMVLYERGVDPDHKAKPFVIGQGRSYRVTAGPGETDVQFLEPQGVGVEHGRIDLESIEARMRMLGAQPFQRTAGSGQATDRRADESKTQNLAQAWVAACERGVETILRQMAHLAATQGDPTQRGFDEALPELAVDIWSDWGMWSDQATDFYGLVQKDHDDGLIPDRVRLEAGKRLQVYPETLDVEETLREAEEGNDKRLAREMQLLEAQARAQSAVTSPTEDDDGEPAPEA